MDFHKKLYEKVNAFLLNLFSLRAIIHQLTALLTDSIAEKNWIFTKNSRNYFKILTHFLSNLITRMHSEKNSLNIFSFKQILRWFTIEFDIKTTRLPNFCTKEITCILLSATTGILYITQQTPTFITKISRK